MLRIIIGIAIGGIIGAGMGYFGKCSTGACPLTATPLRGSLYGAFMGALFAGLGAGGGARAEKVPMEIRESGKQAVIQVLDMPQFEAQVTNGKGVVLVDMYSDRCPPCKALAPTIDKLAHDYKGRAIIAKVNVDKVPEAASKFGVSGIPAVFILKDGEIQQNLVGLRGSGEYAQHLDALLKTKNE
jgi:thioredoxin 1